MTGFWSTSTFIHKIENQPRPHGKERRIHGYSTRVTCTFEHFATPSPFGETMFLLTTGPCRAEKELVPSPRTPGREGGGTRAVPGEGGTQDPLQIVRVHPTLGHLSVVLYPVSNQWSEFELPLWSDQIFDPHQTNHTWFHRCLRHHTAQRLLSDAARLPCHPCVIHLIPTQGPQQVPFLVNSTHAQAQNNQVLLNKMLGTFVLELSVVDPM